MSWLISQQEWSLDGSTGLGLATLLAAIDTDDRPACIVLPGETAGLNDPAHAAHWIDAKPRLGELAKSARACLAGAMVALKDGLPRHVGFLFGPDGACLLTVPKSLPELVGGFADIAADPGAPRQFTFAETPLGRIGIVVGEDILAPPLVRGTVLAGAEIILNPWVETADQELEARTRLRCARAYENSCFVIATSPLTRMGRNGLVMSLPKAASVAGPEGRNLLPDSPASLSRINLDIEALRLRRAKVFPPNFPVYHRTSLFAAEAKFQADQQPPARPIAQRPEWQAEANRRAQAMPEAPALESPSYGALLVQSLHVNVTGREDRDAVYARNIDHIFSIMDGFASIPTVRLAVIPEFGLHGVGFGWPVERFIEMAITLPGPESDRLAAYAQRNRIYICACAYEKDPDWPGRFFNTAFILDDSGNLIHRYRKIMCADLSGMQPVTTPGGVMRHYIDRYGFDGLFPVARTPLGNLATMVCFDVNFSETARALVRRGAEVILHPTSEPHNGWRAGWDLGRRARALENRAYILSAAIGGSYRNLDETMPSFFERGFSKIIDPTGEIALIAEGPGPVPLMGDLDIAALRRLRADPQRNWALWDDATSYLDHYLAHQGYPADVWIEEPMQTGAQGFMLTQAQVNRYLETGLFKPPETGLAGQMSVRAD